MTAVAVSDGYECHSCGATFLAGLVRVPRAWGDGGESMAGAAGLALPYPEAAVVEAETLAEQSLGIATSLPATPLVLGGCCCAHVGAIEGIAARHRRLGVVWLDAHGDLNTPESSPSGNVWGMPLRMLLDAGTVRPSDVALVGARNLDPPEEAFIAATGLRLDVAGVELAMEDADGVYVALDCDVLAPEEGVHVFVPEPGGPTIADVESILARVTASRPLAGLGLTGLTPDDRNVDPLVRLCRAAGI